MGPAVLAGDTIQSRRRPAKASVEPDAQDIQLLQIIISKPSRVEPVADLAESAQFDTCVNLGRCDGGVPQHLLHGAEVGSSRQEMGREAVPERVRAHARAEAAGAGVSPDDPPEADARQGPARPRDEHRRRLRTSCDERGPVHGEERGDRIASP